MSKVYHKRDKNRTARGVYIDIEKSPIVYKCLNKIYRFSSEAKLRQFKGKLNKEIKWYTDILNKFTKYSKSDIITKTHDQGFMLTICDYVYGKMEYK